MRPEEESTLITCKDVKDDGVKENVFYNIIICHPTNNFHFRSE